MDDHSQYYVLLCITYEIKNIMLLSYTLLKSVFIWGFKSYIKTASCKYLSKTIRWSMRYHNIEICQGNMYSLTKVDKI